MAHVHRPLVRLAPRQPPPRLGEVAEDDFLTRRLTHCTQCGGLAQPGDGQMVIYLQDRVAATIQCQRCQKHDPQMTRLHAMLTARYTKGDL